MEWVVSFHDEFKAEFDAFEQTVKDELLAEARFVEIFGPETGRPHVDKLHGSRFANMKELRFEASDGEWRVAFAFDPERKAVLLVAGDKSGVSQKKFYRSLIDRADIRFDQHLGQLKSAKSKQTEPKAKLKSRGRK